MKHIVSYIICLSVIIFVFCSGGNTHSSVGGGGVETTNGVVALSNGEPASFAKVLVIDKENWYSNYVSGSSVVVESTYTDEEGKFTISSYDTLVTNLQVNHEDEGLFVDRFSDSIISSSILTLDKTGTVSVAENVDDKSNLVIYGTAYKETSSSGDGMKMNSIPPGDFMICEMGESGIKSFSTLEMTSAESLSIDSLVPSSDGLLVDDFEVLDSVNGTTHIGLITGSYWYAFMNNTDSDTAPLLERSIETEYSGDKYYRMKTVLNEDASYSYAGFGTYLNSEPIDFSSFEGISFEARGIGVLDMTIENHTVNSLTDNAQNYSAQCTLSTTFEEYIIPFDSLDIGVADSVLEGYTLEDLKQEVLAIEFAFHEYYNTPGDTLKVFIDDIKFYGGDVNEILSGL